MRSITIPAVDWSTVQGIEVVIPVVVDWPELRLTPDQQYANAIAWVIGRPEPFPDNSLFCVRITRP